MNSGINEPMILFTIAYSCDDLDDNIVSIYSVYLLFDTIYLIEEMSLVVSAVYKMLRAQTCILNDFKASFGWFEPKQFRSSDQLVLNVGMFTN